MQWGLYAPNTGRFFETPINVMAFQQFTRLLGFMQYPAAYRHSNDLFNTGFGHFGLDAFPQAAYYSPCIDQKWRSAASFSDFNADYRAKLEPFVRAALGKRLLDLELYMHGEFKGAAVVRYFAIDLNLFSVHCDAVRAALQNSSGKRR